MSQWKEARYMTSETDPRSCLVLSKINPNVYCGRNPCYSKKLQPIDKSVIEKLVKSLRVLTQIATQNKILSHKLEIETYYSVKVLEFLSFQIAHVTTQTAPSQSDLIDFFIVYLNNDEVSQIDYRVRPYPIQTHWTLSPTNIMHNHIVWTDEKWFQNPIYTWHTGWDVSNETTSCVEGHR